MHNFPIAKHENMFKVGRLIFSDTNLKVAYIAKLY